MPETDLLNASIVVFGAGGFLGRHLLVKASSAKYMRAVTRRAEHPVTPPGVEWVQADLLAPASIDAVLRPNDTVINLAYARTGGEVGNLRMIDNLLQACFGCRVRRLVHCSTAVVVGATKILRVDESTPCLPVTPYERCKWAVEQKVVAAGKAGLDAMILRPTVIVGPGGVNLASLAHTLWHGSNLLNYARASLFGNRLMHLVPVATVAAALLHLATIEERGGGEVFIVAADDDEDNHFPAIERLLRETLGLPPHSAALPLPRALLVVLKRALGHSDLGLDREYVSDKLRARGFVPPVTVAAAVREFGNWVRCREEA